MTTKYAFSFSRRDAPGVVHARCPQKNRGRRECRVRAAPAVSRAKCTSKCAHEHTGSAEAIRHSLRDGFTVSFALSLVTGFLATIIPEKLASQELDASIGASGPHDFAVRFTRRSSRAYPRPPHPAPRFLTIASAPLVGSGWRKLVEMICPTTEGKYFREEGWTAFVDLPDGRGSAASTSGICLGAFDRVCASLLSSAAVR
jgi:hypothetical protein